jgi:ferrous iron transport protein B
VAYFLGASAALLIYILNIIVVVSTGKMLSSLMPEVSPGMIMEVPRYQWPTVQTILHKVWFRIREFVVIAWPLLILGSVVLGIVEFLNWDAPVNGLLSPLTVLLGLPAAVGITLIFGVLRKELVLVMLIQALGTQDVLSVLTPAQVMVFAVFVTFYVPCVATIAILRNELGVGATTVVVGITLLLATGLALLTRLGCAILW